MLCRVVGPLSQDGTADAHRQALQRVLFVFAKTNPGLQYVQVRSATLPQRLRAILVAAPSALIGCPRMTRACLTELSSSEAQGMNELLAPFFYLCATDPTAGAAENAEADSFYCLVLLMADFRCGQRGQYLDTHSLHPPADLSAARRMTVDLACCCPQRLLLSKA